MKENFTHSLHENLLDLIPCIIYQIVIEKNKAKRLLHITKQIKDLTNYSPEELQSSIQLFINLFHPEDYLKFESLFSIKKKVFTIEQRLYSRRNKVNWVKNQWRTIPIDKNLDLLSGVLMQDIPLNSKEHEIEAKNFFLEEIQQALHSTSIISITNTSGIIKFANKKFCEISEFSEEELVGKPHSIINSGLHSKEFWNSLWTTIKKGQIWRGEIRNKSKKGNFYWVDTYIVPIKNKEGKIIEYLSLRNDITDKKNQEEQLKLLSKISSETSDLVLIADSNGVIEWVNSSFEKKSGYSYDEIRGKPYTNYFERFEYNFNGQCKELAIAGSENPYIMETFLITKRSFKIWVEIKIQRLDDSTWKSVKFFFIIRDISIQKQIVNDLILALDRAKKADKLKTSILSNISHEIKTPMNAILGFSELLSNPNLPESKRNNFLHLIRLRSYDLLNIINSLLEFSKIDGGYITLNEKTDNIEELITKLLHDFSQENLLLKNKAIQFNFINHLTEHENFIRADFFRLNQVLTNLIQNAIKFTERGSITIECKYFNQHTLLFIVSDTGIGIPADKLFIIFEPFHQLKERRNKTFEGFGLGLAICKGIVELWKGKIWVTSKEGKGSSFYFTLPLKN